MTYKSFLGYGYGWASDPNMWTPWGAPTTGDNLQVTHGIPFLGDSTFGNSAMETTINIVGTLSNPVVPALLVWNEKFVSTNISNITSTVGDYTPRIGQVVIADKVTLDKSSAIFAGSNMPNSGTAMYVWDSNNSQLINNGSLGAAPEATLDVEGGTNSYITNNGNITAAGGKVIINSDVVGTGNIWSEVAFMQGGNVDLKGTVGPGQTLHMEQGSMVLEKPTQFSGIVDIGPSRGVLMLNNLAATSWADVPNSSLVELFNKAGTPIDVLNIIPQPNGQVTFTNYNYSNGGSSIMLSEQYVPTGTVMATHGTIASQNVA